MKKVEGLGAFSPYRLRSQLPRFEASRILDALMFAGGLAMFYGILVVGRKWLGPFTPEVEISRSPLALPMRAIRCCALPPPTCSA